MEAINLMHEALGKMNSIPEVIEKATVRSISFPLKPRTKAEIDRNTEEFLNDALEVHSAAELLVLARQMETAAEYLIEKLKADDLALNSLGRAFGGAMAGQVMGADVKISYPKRWTYDPEIQAAISTKKAEIKLLETQAQLAKLATQSEGKAVITITLKGGE